MMTTDANFTNTQFSETNIIRVVSLDDLLDIERVNRSVKCLNWTTENFCSELNSAHSMAYAIYDAVTMRGFIVGRSMESEAEIYGIAVEPSLQRKGLGNELLNFFEERCRVTSANVQVFLEVRAANDRARNFYLKHGYQVVGLRKNYYISPVDDAVLMSKMLHRN